MGPGKSSSLSVARRSDSRPACCSAARLSTGCFQVRPASALVRNGSGQPPGGSPRASPGRARSAPSTSPTRLAGPLLEVRLDALRDEPLGAGALARVHRRHDRDVDAAGAQRAHELVLARRAAGAAGRVRQLGREQDDPHAPSTRATASWPQLPPPHPRTTRQYAACRRTSGAGASRYGESSDAVSSAANAAGEIRRARLEAAAPAQRPRQRAQHRGLRAQLRAAASPAGPRSTSSAASKPSSAGAVSASSGGG